MALEKRSDGQSEQLSFHSLRLHDVIHAADKTCEYALRVLAGGRKPLVEFWWRSQPVGGQPQPWYRGAEQATLCGHSADAKRIPFTNELGGSERTYIPIDPVGGEIALERRLWISYPREQLGNYESFASLPLSTLYIERPSQDATS